MGLQGKFVIPVVFGVLVLMGIIHWIWGPTLLQDKQRDLYLYNEEVLEILAEGIIPHLLSSDLATLHATLDHHHEHQPSWLQLTLYNSEQKILYPLFPSEVPAAGHHILRIDREIAWKGEDLGSIVLILDIEKEVNYELARIRQLELYALSIFILIGSLSLLWQRLFIVLPLMNLQRASEQLSKGEFDYPLRARGSDEVAKLTRAFESMRGQLLATSNELKQALHDTQESEMRHRTVLENMTDGVILLDCYGRIESVNPAVEYIFGYSHEQLLMMSLQSLRLCQGEGCDDLILTDVKCQKCQAIHGTLDVVSRYADGRPIDVEWSIKEMSLGGEQMYIAIVRDITDRKRVEKLKSEFVSTVSHELRTPLTSIRGVLGLLSGGILGEVSEKGKNMLSIASSNVERLSLLINDLLDIQKMEAGEMSFHFERLEMNELVAKGVEENIGYSQEYGVILNLTLPKEPIWCQLDGGRFAQILSNLLSNAAKFSPQGATIEIELYRQVDWAMLNIRDRGPGIPEDFQHKLFEKFTQHDSSDTRNVGGTGLGLSITKGLVERQGGIIEFVSEEGKGTTFTISFPAEV